MFKILLISTAKVLEPQIEKIQEKVKKTKVAYYNVVNNLQKILDKRDALRIDVLWKLIAKSDKLYEDVLDWLKKYPHLPIKNIV